MNDPISPYPPPSPPRPPARKRKWAAGLLSFLFPGLGHMYAGAMHRGLFFMLLLIGVVFGVVLASIEGIVPLIVLLSVLIPVVYFYALFDALQTTERENEARELRYRNGGVAGFEAPDAVGAKEGIGGAKIGLGLIAVGALLFAATDRPDWLRDALGDGGTLFGAVAFLVIGGFMFATSSKKNR